MFQDETTTNTEAFPSPFEFLAKREWEWTAKDRGLFIASPIFTCAWTAIIPSMLWIMRHDAIAGIPYSRPVMMNASACCALWIFGKIRASKMSFASMRASRKSRGNTHNAMCTVSRRRRRVVGAGIVHNR